MSTQSSSTSSVKDHKPSKVMALSIIWAAVALVVFLIVSDGVGLLQGKNPSIPDATIVGVTPATKGDVRQPVSPKIGGTEEGTSVPLMGGESDYVVVWEKLDHLATVYGHNSGKPEAKEERLVFIIAFMSTLNYKVTGHGEPILSQVDGEPIDPNTLLCYLNGYIPDKPHLKPNCPSY